MTPEYRTMLRQLVDMEKRRRLAKAESNYVLDHHHSVDTPRGKAGYATRPRWEGKYPAHVRDAVLARVRELGNVKMAAAEFGVPRTTVNEWVRWNSVPRGE